MAPPRIGKRRGALLLLLLLAGCGQEPETAPAPGAPGAAPPQEAPPSAAPARPAREEQAPASAKRADSGDETAPMPATVSRDTELKKKPFLDAKTVAPLAAGSAVTVLERRGGWFRVTSDGREGWVRLLHVSTQPGTHGIGAEELESAAQIATGRTGGGNIANTTGVRGLTPEQLRQAKPDMDELQRLQDSGVGDEQARAYARKHDLARRDVPPLPEPE